MIRLTEIPGRLYRGEISVNIVGRQRMWYLISGIIILVSSVALGVRGLNFNVDFKGGSVFQFQANGASQAAISRVVSGAGGGSSSAQFLSQQHQWQVTTSQLKPPVSLAVQDALEKAFHVVSSGMSVKF